MKRNLLTIAGKAALASSLMLLSSSLVQAQIPTNGLLEQFTFNNTKVGVNNTTLNTTEYYTTDRFGNASSAHFVDSAANTIEVTRLNSLPQRNADRTVAFWFKRKQEATHSLFSYSRNDSSFALAIQSNTLNMVNGNNTVSSVAVTYDTAWHHVAVTHGASSTILYYDNVASAPSVTVYGNNDSLFRSGRSPWGGDYQKFVIDELLIYNRALTASEIAAIYNDGNTTSVNEDKIVNVISVFPNPANEYVTISNLTKGAALSIADIAGKTLYNATAPSDNITINTQDFVNGIYFIKIQSNGKTSYQKLMISK